MFWRKKKKYTCATCGGSHVDLPALAYSVPFYYAQLSDQMKQSSAEASEDFCVIRHPDQTDRFVRTTLSIPINDIDCTFEYGLWVSLSEKSFTEYASEFKSNVEGRIYFGYISNELSPYEESTLSLHVNVITRSDGIRPILQPHECDHPLFRDWCEGIALKEAEARVAKMLGH